MALSDPSPGVRETAGVGPGDPAYVTPRIRETIPLADAVIQFETILVKSPATAGGDRPEDSRFSDRSQLGVRRVEP